MTSSPSRPAAPGTAAPKSNLEWQAWGERDPLFGVIPLTGREKDGASPWTDADFYETGRRDWQEFAERWSRYGLVPESCVEIGCGAGRLTAHIAGTFKEVYGLDVAEGMIAYARPHMPANVYLQVTDGQSLPVADASASAVFSVIVFLHFDHYRYAQMYFREMARVLKPGGTIMIQLPLHTWPTNVKSSVVKFWNKTYQLYMGLRRAKGAYHRFQLLRKSWSPFMQSISYDSMWLDDTLTNLGFRDIETCAFRPARGGAVYSWVFARKS